MKLDKNTKHLVNIGDYLTFGDGTKYIVTNVIKGNQNSICFTINCTESNDKWMLHRTLYSYPSSQLYGAEITFS